MKKPLSVLLVVGVMLPSFASASVIGDVFSGLASIPEQFSALVQIFQIKRPSSALGLVESSYSTSSPETVSSSSVVITGVDLPATINDASRLTYGISIMNNGQASVSGVSLSAYLLQEISGRTRRSPAGGSAVQCGGERRGVIPLGECRFSSSTFTVRGNVGTATAVFELRMQSNIIAEYRFPVTIEARLIKRNLSVMKQGLGKGSVTSNPSGIDCGRDCMEQYAVSSSIILTAQPEAGSVFTGWTGCGVVSSSQCVVIMRGAERVTARFDVRPIVSTSTVTLSVSKNPALTQPTYPANRGSAKIGSYTFTASASEGVNLNRISIVTFATGSSPFANLRLMVGNTQFGTVIPSLRPYVSSSFSGTLSIPPGGNRTVDVYADILSGPLGTYPTATAVTDCTGQGAATFASVSCPYVAGQGVVLGGQPSLVVTIDASSPPNGQLVMGSSNNPLAVFRFNEVSNLEDIKVTSLNVFDSVSSISSVKPAFSNLTLSYSGANELTVASPARASTNGRGYYYTFNFANPIIVPQNGSILALLKGDVASFSSSGATDNTTHVFKIATSTDSDNDTTAETVNAYGKTSNASSFVSLNSSFASTQTVLRNKLTVTASGIGPTTSRTKSAVDDLGTINFSADATGTGSLLLGLVRVTLAGSALTGQPLSTSSISLYDPVLGLSFPLVSFASSTADFNLNDYQLAAGSTKDYRLRLNSTLLAPGQQGISQTLSARINFATDVRYKTGPTGGSTVNLLPRDVPIMINSVSYTPGT